MGLQMGNVGLEIPADMPHIIDLDIPEWRCAYAWSEDRGGQGLKVRYFRRAFQLDAAPQELRVYVTADSRYRLWVNGEAIGRGPIKGTLENYAYEVYDLAPHLRAGRNVIAAEARHFGVNFPTSEVHSPEPGFALQGPEDAGLDTPGQWKVLVDEAVTPDTTAYIGNAQGFLNHTEHVDVRRYPLGWREIEFDDTDWQDAVDAGPADVSRTCGVFPPRDLHPRDVPLLVEEPRRFVRTIQDHREVGHLFADAPKGWKLDAGQAGELIVDVGCLTTGYPEVSVRGGAGREMCVIYAEAMGTWRERRGRRAWRKDIRDDIENGEPHGYRDTVVLPGGDYTFEPFHWRTFWFLKIEVSAGEEPFELTDLTYRFTTFPQDFSAEFESSDPDLKKMLRISTRTLQLCAHETYEDCPYYEQLNYIGDTRLQALGSYYLANETALARRCIRLYRDSLRPDGLVHSRVPSVRRQILPYFSLIWVLMVEDYWRWVGARDQAFVRSCLYAVDGVLWFFRERLRDNGFVGKIPHWSMVDRAEGWQGGEPPAIGDGESTYLTCLYVCALEAAVRLHTQAGEPLDAHRWQALPDKLRSAVREAAWSEEEGLYLEGPGRTQDRLSQHSQCLAILSDTASPEQSARILERLTQDPALHRMHFMQSFYLGRALEKAGGYAAFVDHLLIPWREAMAKRVSTWQEYPDPTRSDCHAWGSWIAVDFMSAILGVKPAEPGFTKLLIAPQTQALEHARGRLDTPAGTVSVNWRKDDSGGITLEADTPAGVPVEIRLLGREPQMFPTGGQIRLP